MKVNNPISLTIAIPVRNEAKNLPGCLEGIGKGFAQRVVVIDSGSTDETSAISKSYGAEVIQFKWDGKFPKKRNWYLLNHDIDTKWILFLDADEILTPQFKKEVRDVLPHTAYSGFWLRYSIYFQGKVLRGGYPLAKLALFRKGKGLYEKIHENNWSQLDMEVHEHPVIEGSTGVIASKIDHRDLRGLESWKQKHSEYAKWEASRFLSVGKYQSHRWTLKQKFKYCLIQSGLIVPVYFLGAYFFLGGFIDGKRGFQWALLKADYFKQIRSNIRRLKKSAPVEKLLGISFSNIGADALVEKALKPGLFVVPSGPGLCQDFRKNLFYREALLRADTVCPDSGALAIFAKILKGVSLRRVSGLRLLQGVMFHPKANKPNTFFFVHPNKNQKEKTLDWLERKRFPVELENHYVAPIYRKPQVEDLELYKILKQKKPKVLLLGVGGGIQEPLGLWIRTRFLDEGIEPPSILCIGAALAFIVGTQATIPVWADRLYLGWLLRCLSSPGIFIPRYFSAFPLLFYLLKYGKELPPMKP